MFKTLPTRQEMEEYIDVKLEGYVDRFEALIKRELRATQESMAKLTDKLLSLEKEVINRQKQVDDLGKTSQDQQKHILGLALKTMDLENRGRRNNIRLRGIPETIGPDKLWDTVLTILNFYRGQPSQERLELDRVHRVPGPRGNNANNPRDVLCRVHFFQDKDTILRTAWDKGPYHLEGARVILLQDLAKNTLAMRRQLKPLLEVALQQGATYKWGFPFQLVLKKNRKFFVLRSHDQLADAFAFLGAQPIEVKNWLEEALVFS